MSVFVLNEVQKLPVNIKEAWKFFSDPHNLLAITPPALQLKVTNRLFGNQVYPGQIITYKVKPLLNIPFFWMTEITHVDEEKLFVDEQRKGPYALWHHQHHFKPINGGVEMTDIVHYKIPFGIIGTIAHKIIVHKKVKEIFKYRNEQIEKLFGKWKES